MQHIYINFDAFVLNHLIANAIENCQAAQIGTQVQIHAKLLCIDRRHFYFGTARLYSTRFGLLDWILLNQRKLLNARRETNLMLPLFQIHLLHNVPLIHTAFSLKAASTGPSPVAVT